MSRRVAISDIVVMRRSLGMASALPTDQTQWLLSETERLLRERAEIEAAVARLTDPWTDVRAILNDLAAVVNRTTQ
jgi:hypothetical protein